MKILVIIPARNEEQAIGRVVRSVIEQGYAAAVVNDGSQDDTAAVAQAAGAIVLSHPTNRGQGAAIRTGVAYAASHNFGLIVFFDADGQMMATEIKQLVQPLLLGQYQVALGSRFLGTTAGLPLARRWLLYVARWFTRLTSGLPLTDVHNGFQAWQLEAFQSLKLVQDRYAYASELLYEISDKQLKYIEVPVTITYSAYSKARGQRLSGAFMILWDLLIKR